MAELLRGLTLSWLLVGCFNASVFATPSQFSLDPQDRSATWSIGAHYQWSKSPYLGESHRTDFMPAFIYSGPQIYFNTTELGWHVVDNSQWQLDLYANYFLAGYNDHTFFSDSGEVRPEDDPLKGMERSSALEAGAGLTYKTAYGRFRLDVDADINNTHNGSGFSGQWSRYFRFQRWAVQPWLQLNWYSAGKTNYYFGVTQQEATEQRPAYTLGDASSVQLGSAVSYQLDEAQSISLSVSYQQFASSIVHSPIVDERGIVAVSLDYRYQFHPNKVTTHSTARAHTKKSHPWSARLAYGCTTADNMGFIGSLNFSCDGTGNSLASLFLSRQLSPTFMQLPIEAWLTTGLAHRMEQPYQGNFFEGVLAFKAIYRQFPWSNRWETRFGVAEGFSYASKVPYQEQVKAETRERRSSRLLNYLDFSLDVNIADMTGIKQVNNCFWGIAVHHRSGIFAASYFYNNVFGGSNVNTVYIECEYR